VSPRNNKAKIPEPPPNVAAVFESYPASVRKKLLAVRKLIFETAARTDGVGPLTETLKWGEPSYLTETSKSGSTIRLGPVKESSNQCAVYFICTTDLLDSFRTLFADDLVFGGNRSILLETAEPLPKGPLASCLEMALTYKLRKKKRK